MASIAPPPPLPPTALADGDDLSRLRLRLQQMFLTAVTVFVTAYFVTLGPVPAVLSLAVAKHVLVAILVMGLGVDETRRSDD